MAKGTFYGVGVGPGDPGLLTLRAAEVIRACPVVATPRTRDGAMVALDIAKQAVDLKGKTLLPLDFAMRFSAEEREASHQKGAAAVREHLDAGRDVAMLNLGDVSLYASFQYIADILREDGYAVEMVAGVTSFCAAAAALNTSLTSLSAPVHILPGHGKELGLGWPGTKIYMKSASALPDLLAKLEDAGQLDGAMLVQNCGMPSQRVFKNLGQADAAQIPEDYFSIVIVKETQKG